jgi:hypothetical protein
MEPAETPLLQIFCGDGQLRKLKAAVSKGRRGAAEQGARSSRPASGLAAGGEAGSTRMQSWSDPASVVYAPDSRAS